VRDYKFIDSSVNVVPQRPEFLGGPVTIDLWWFNIDVLKAMG
jgi:hypothetical protein